MFASFSWTNYFLFVGFLLFAYFIIIGCTCYKKEIFGFFGKKDLMQEAIDAPVKHTRENSLPIVHELVSELGVIIRKAAEDHVLQPELFYSLQQSVRQYLILRPTEFPEKINQYIREELSRRELPALAEEQYAALWNA